MAMVEDIIDEKTKKTFPVLEMSCAACANSVETILQSQPGVVHATVNFANATANVEYNNSLTNSNKLKSAVQSIGYDLMIDDSEKAKEDLEKIKENNALALKRKAIGALICSIPLFLLAMIPSLMHQQWARVIMWLLATPVVFYFGKQFYVNAWKQLQHKSANMDTLVALSTGVAYIYSVISLFFPNIWLRNHMEPHVYFEASAVVITFVLLGRILEEKAKNNTSSAIKKLMGLQPKTVTIIQNGQPIESPIQDISLGNILLVKPGEKIAVDGVVVEGTSYIDESMLSGEPIAVKKDKGNKVLAGTINQNGTLQYKAEKIGSDTVLAQIIQSVQDAQGSKAPVQKLVDKIASIFVPIVLIIAVISFILWYFLAPSNNISMDFSAFVTVLVIACPCALGLATPTAIMVGIGKGAENGILIKDAVILEKAEKITDIVLDKTGTITQGNPSVVDSISLENLSETEKNIFYSIEANSQHPLAKAIANSLGKNAQLLKVQISNLDGKGIEGIFESEKYYIGNKTLLDSLAIQLPTTIEKWSVAQFELARTVVFLLGENKILAGMAIADAIKPSSKEAIEILQNNFHIQIHLLTGDNSQTANEVAQQLGIKNVVANALPSDKLDYIKSIQKKGKVVAMVGDGINDSNALAQADVSIAMGNGSDIAMDVAQMTILSSDLKKIPQAIQLSKQTEKTIRTNLFWAFIYNVIGIPIAAGALYPINHYLLNPMIAGAAMAFSSVSVVCNSLLLKSKKLL